MGSGAAQADAVAANSYKPGDYLTLDLRAALLSPKPLGPGAQFEAYPITARADAKNEIDAKIDAKIDAVADKPAAQKAVPVAKPPRATATRPQPPARARVARPRSNPLDANAADTRIQTWPCRTGGICAWQR
ncbi:hypothetical protein RPMA_06125 [Tardiphaga alba]|uniref:Uncharacterized protein n=1 Tax=Tardiphaga alba TaxID=340268 RepID=A0ABX8AEU6_9BRAD|nr:hypothetical protein RPMA_06125 [Tardiphaga alba]